MKNSFDEAVFKSRVSSALDRVRTILDNTRTPQYAADVSHEYSDKYLLAEYLTQSAVAAHHTTLEVCNNKPTPNQLGQRLLATTKQPCCEPLSDTNVMIGIGSK